MGKNAISVINEYAQRCKMLLKYEESMSGPDHMKTYEDYNINNIADHTLCTIC